MKAANPSRGWKKEMAKKFSLYCQTPESCEYLTGIINSSPGSVLAETRTLENLPERVNSGAHAILLEYQEGQPQLDQWIKKISADPQNPPIFLYFQEISTEQLWKALRLGVKECFSRPIRSEEFKEAVDRLAVLPLEAGRAENTRIISVFGCKGGVGTTFLAVNLAFLLAQETSGQVMLLDLDLKYGQMVHFLDAKPKYSLVDVIENADQLERSYLLSLLSPCGENLFLLPAPVRFEDVEAVSPENLDKVMRWIKGLGVFKYMVVDAGHEIEEVNLKALDLSDKVIVLVAPSIPALSNAKKLLELLHLVGLDGQALEVWLNAWQKHGELTLADVSGFLGRKVEVTLPADPDAVGRSINEGQPLVSLAPRHPFCRELKILAEGWWSSAQAEKNSPRRGWWKFLGRKK